MDQAALGRLAEQAARLAEKGDAAALSTLVAKAADRHHLANHTVAGLIAREWDRLGIVRVPRGTPIGRV